MRKLGLGFMLGLIVGCSGAAFAATIFGEDGYLSGWIIVKDDQVVCSEPFVRVLTHELQCE
jgi:hypothetical protein